MPSGGARSRSGPPPDPAALRRDRDPLEWLTLPVDGRSGPAPKMPFEGEPGPLRDAEVALWGELWSLPQATEWERLRLHLEVALYVRAYMVAMFGAATAADRGVVVRLADSLGLNTAGMARNKWKIGIVAADAAASSAPKTKRRPSARERLSLVPGGGA